MVTQIPLSPVPNQELTIMLGANQRCVVHVYDRLGRLYLDLVCNNEPVQYGAICLPFAPIITAVGRPFVGQLRIIDRLTRPHAQTIPHYEGLGTRYFMYYLPQDEEAQLNAQ